MPKFINNFKNTVFFEQALSLYNKYSKYLDDDYANNGLSPRRHFIELINRTYPYFFVIVENNEFAGLVYLDNFIGDSKNLHSAELTTCMIPKYWGAYTRLCAIQFINYCFVNCGLKKIKACVYPENSRVKNLLEFSGFKKEGILKGETLKNGKLQDIEVYGCLKTGERDKLIGF